MKRMVKHQILKRSIHGLRRKLLISKYNFYTDKIENIKLCSLTQVENILSLDENILDMTKKLEKLNEKCHSEILHIIKRSSGLNLKEKLQAVKTEHFGLHNSPIIAKLNKDDLLQISKKNIGVERCNRNLTLKQTAQIDKIQKLSLLEKNSMEFHKVIKSLSKNPSVAFGTATCGTLVIGHQYVETGQAIINLSKKLVQNKTECLVNYRLNLEVSECLCFTPYFKNEEPF